MTDQLKAGDKDYKAYVGPIVNYDVLSIIQFAVLCQLNLRMFRKVLDIGCGSLRLGKLLIPFLNEGNYHGIEPNKWVCDQGLKNELGDDIKALKKPNFYHFDDFKLSRINEKFDMIMAHSIFTHASEKQIRTCLDEVNLILKPQGLFAANFNIGKTNYAGDEWVYPGCVPYTLGFIAEMAKDAGLKVIYCEWTTPHVYKTHIFCHPERYISAVWHIAERAKILDLYGYPEFS